jgi:hypothetical protein
LTADNVVYLWTGTTDKGNVRLGMGPENKTSTSY